MAEGEGVQVEDEVTAFLKMLDEVYAVFGLQYSLALSTRPEGYLGELALWDQAEKALEDALNKTGAPPFYPQKKRCAPLPPSTRPVCPSVYPHLDLSRQGKHGHCAPIAAPSAAHPS